MVQSKTALVVSKFTEKVENDVEYSVKELMKLLETTYKEVYTGKRKVSNNNGEKKPPSAYNLFIKSEIEKIKGEKIEGVDPKDYMKLAAQRWKEHKEKTTA